MKTMYECMGYPHVFQKTRHLIANIIVVIGLCFGYNAATAADDAVSTSLITADDNSFAHTQLLDIQKTPTSIDITLNTGEVSIVPLNKGTVEVFYQPDNIRQLPSFAIDRGAIKSVDVSLTPMTYSHSASGDLGINEGDKKGYKISLPSFDIHVHSSPFKLQYFRDGELLISEAPGLFVYDTMRGFRFAFNDQDLSGDYKPEKIMGGGQRVLGMDRRGHRMPLYNKAHYGYNGKSTQMYFGLPAIMSEKGYAIGFDNSARGTLDIGHTESNILQFDAVGGRTSYLFSAGDNVVDTVKHFVSATGKQPLPPRWALGNYASRFGYRSQAEALNVIEAFQTQDFPIDALVLDLYWFGKDIKGHMGNLRWDLDAFPDPEGMIDTLNRNGVNTILITEPFILSRAKQWASAVKHKALAKNIAGAPRRFDFYFGNTGLVDVFDPAAQDWFWQFYEGLNKQGVAGWWGDLGEPEVHPSDSLHRLNDKYVTADEVHNAYGHQWAKMVYERQRKARPSERPFVMMRAGFLGSQRYGMIPWTGDVERSWAGLRPQVELALQMSMFGLAYTHSDLGGFAGGEQFDPELYIRWMQYGVFQPVYRPHAQDHIAPEPIFHDENTKNIVREFVKLRYRLLPYNYSLSIENALTGMPMMRPLIMHHPDASFNTTSAYLWGEHFLVSPVLTAEATSQMVELPDGIWFDYFSGQRYIGGSARAINTNLETLPVFVKAGSFIPSTKDIPNTRAYSSAQLDITYYADEAAKTSDYRWYDDDGKDPNSLTENAYNQVDFASAHDADSLSFTINGNGLYKGAPKDRTFSFTVLGLDKKPRDVTISNKINADQDSKQQKQQWSWDQGSQALIFQVTMGTVNDMAKILVSKNLN